MGRMCRGDLSPGARTGRGEAAGAGLAGRFRRLILRRAVKKAVRSIARPAAAHLLRDIGLDPADADRLACHLHVLAAAPFHVCVKPNARSTKLKPRSR